MIVVNLAPSGGPDDAAIQNALDSIVAAGGGKLVLGPGTYLRAATATIPHGPILIEGAGSQLTTMLGTNPNAIYFSLNWPGAANCPRGYGVKGITFTGRGQALKLISSGAFTDPSTWIYDIDLEDLQFDNMPDGWCIELRRCMDPRLNRITARSNSNVLYTADCGCISVGDFITEGNGIAWVLDGTVDPANHMREGPTIDRWTSNGDAFGLFLRNYAFVTGSALQITSSTQAAVLVRGTCLDVHLNGVFGGTGSSPAIHFDPDSDGQPSGPSQRFSIEGEIYGSTFGVLAKKVDALDVSCTFTGNSQQDVLLDFVRNSHIHDCQSTSAPVPTSAQANIYETGTCSDNLFTNNTLRFPVVSAGARSVVTGTKGLAPGT